MRFVPLVGKQGWAPEAGFPATQARPPSPRKRPDADLVQRIARTCEPFDNIETVDLMARIGEAKIVLLGEATHGTSEFYRMRERITKELVLKKRV